MWYIYYDYLWYIIYYLLSIIYYLSYPSICKHMYILTIMDYYQSINLFKLCFIIFII